MTTLHDQIAEALKAARTGLCEWPAFGDDEKDVVLLAKIDAALSRLDALSSEVAELRRAANFAIDWLESYNVPRQATGDERDEVIDRLRAALAKGEA
jgi:hypothetical protein